MIDKAGRSLAAARRLAEAGDHDFAISRAYYSAFYAMQAALECEGPIHSSTHAATISEFNRRFIKQGVFPSEFGRLISRLFRRRQTGDYSFSLPLTKTEAQSAIATADEILGAVEVFLVDRGYDLGADAPDKTTRD